MTYDDRGWIEQWISRIYSAHLKSVAKVGEKKRSQFIRNLPNMQWKIARFPLSQVLDKIGYLAQNAHSLFVEYSRRSGFIQIVIRCFSRV